jgi:carbon storage regulator
VLIVSRRVGEKVMIGDDVVVEVLEVTGSLVRLGVQAPRSIPVYREEIWEAIRAENQAAATADPAALPTLPRPPAS